MVDFVAKRQVGWVAVRNSGIQSRAVGVVLPQSIQFGKYTLFERIGRGGMADVFKARVQGPAGFERIFVVKRILPHLSGDPAFTKMFIEEAKLSARLAHPNIVQVFELGSVEGEYFMSMEHVRGRDLAETMRTLWARIGPPRPELVAYVGREMSRALAYAHDLTGDDGTPLGMIHRDVSPSNVMLSYEGAVKLLDFGIAKAFGGESKEEGGTQRGTLKGKFAYMAPEQTQGNEFDRRIDIFAAGIVLHEVLTGRRLFKGDNDLHTIEKVRQCDVPPPSLQNPLCPPDLDAIVLRALSKNRDERFQTGSELADALDDVVHAARFQPSHLALLMRDLFPADAGGESRHTGSARVPHTASGSGSRPHSHSVMRSPTIPPVSRSSSSVRAPLPADQSALSQEPHKPFYGRGTFWATAIFVAAAFGGGAVYTRSTVPPPQSAGPKENQPRVLNLKLVLSSLPEGASVYVKGTNQSLGQTPFRKEFEWREDAQTILVFKLKGYEEVEREVRPTWTGFVHLRPGGSAHGKVQFRSLTGSTSAPKEAPAATPPAVPPAGSRPAADPPSGAEPRSSSGTSRRGGQKKPSGKPNELQDPFK